jgi:hypothetical protein
MAYRRNGLDFLFRPGRPGLGTVLVAIWAGFMVATAGAAVYPPVTAIVTPLVCSGEAQTDSQTYSTRPGKTIVTRQFNCIGDNGKPESVMFETLAATFAVYALIAFVLLTLLGFWRGRKGAAAPEPAPTAALDSPFVRPRTVDLGERPFRVRPSAMAGEGIEARLEVLNGLREAGLISDADYDAKKAEILSRL